MKRTVLAALLALSFGIPTLAAQAGSSFHAKGVVSSVDATHHLLTIRDSGGDKAYQGHTLTIRTNARTRIQRDGKTATLAALHAGDTVDASGGVTHGLLATTVDSSSPPHPDGPAVAVPSECLGYYLPCTPKPSALGGSAQVSITISNFTFDPPVSVVPAGTIVTVHNADPFAHTFNGTHLDSGVLNGGDTYSVEFTTPGTYRFYCSIHPFMTGILEVQ